MTFAEAVRIGAQRLQEAGIESGRAEAAQLLMHCCGMDRTSYLLRAGEEMPEKEKTQYLRCVEKREERIPLQHITGEAPFMGYLLRSDGRALVPRPDTEVLVSEAAALLEKLPEEVSEKLPERVLEKLPEKVSEELPEKASEKLPEKLSEKFSDKFSEELKDDSSRHLRVLDLCTGSGCIAVSLKKMFPTIDCEGSDLSREALELAAENGRRLSAEVSWICSDLFEDLSGTYDMIVSNPPYIATEEIAALDIEVRDYDPSGALDGGSDGLDFYRRICADAPRYLKPGGWLLFEIGWDQAAPVQALLEENGFSEVRTVRDLAGRDRVVCACLKQKGE